MGVAKMRITNQLFELAGINARLFGQMFLNLPPNTKLVDVLDEDGCVEFRLHHPYFKNGGEITAMFSRTACVVKEPYEEIEYFEQFIGLNFDYALEKL